MSNKSNNQGRAYEFACLLILEEEIKKYRTVEIEEIEGYFSAKEAWETLSTDEKYTYKRSALAGVEAIFDYEPLILENSVDTLKIKIQVDNEGEKGDVRDIIISRKGISWEIGLSVKHNHFAVKHSRLSHSLDFGEKWYNNKCSTEYWKDIKDIFDMLKREKGKKWSDLSNKEEDVYFPLLKAFKNEILRKNQFIENKIPRKMVEYLLGEFDFYKLISIDNKKITQIQSFNLRGNLNQDSLSIKKKNTLPIVNLPTRIVSFDFKPNSMNTLELYLDQGWQFSFRIHNASSKIESSLKFDIQIIGMPATIITLNCIWKY